MNIQKMLKQAQTMQKQMEETQQELGNVILEGTAGGGVITVKVTGKNDFVSIKIKPEAINPENPESVDPETIEMLEDLITSAVKDAMLKANTISQEKLNAITGGMNLNMPGLF
jgi:nucleoid-associated protein EbfC